MNHLYIEKTLQPAYTAGLFYLFQDGVVRDVLNSTETKVQSTESLAFLRNSQLIDVKMSSPLPNVILTFVECAILLIVALSICVCGERREAKLHEAAAAHTIVEALMNDTKFPSLLVTTTLEGNAKNETEDSEASAETAASLDGFRVKMFILEHPDGRQVEIAPGTPTSQGLAIV